YQRRLEPSLADAEPGLPPGVRIRPSRPEDAAALEAIAEGGYTDSRFYFDARFPREKAAEMYRTWGRQSVARRAAVALVLGQAGRGPGGRGVGAGEGGAGGGVHPLPPAGRAHGAVPARRARGGSARPGPGPPNVRGGPALVRPPRRRGRRVRDAGPQPPRPA